MVNQFDRDAVYPREFLDPVADILRHQECEIGSTPVGGEFKDNADMITDVDIYTFYEAEVGEGLIELGIGDHVQLIHYLCPRKRPRQLRSPVFRVEVEALLSY